MSYLTGAAHELRYFSDNLKKKIEMIRISKATIVEAPSGFGKTTAIVDFVEKKIPKGVPVFWFTATDESPVSSYHRLCLEVEKIDPFAGARLLELELPNAATVGEACEAIHSLKCERETYLVVDNFHFLNSSLSPAFFASLLEHGGTNLHIIILVQMLGRKIHTAIASRGFLHITASDLRLNTVDILNFFALSGIPISQSDAETVSHFTEGWIIAVYLQLCCYRDSRTFTEGAILSLMEHLVWDTLTEEQQAFLMLLSPFGTFNDRLVCHLIGSDTLPDYAMEVLRCPFIRYENTGQRYEMHSILAGLLIKKRDGQPGSFRCDCLRRAGDFYRWEQKIALAFGFYAQAEDFDRMLSLDISNILLEDIGSKRFSEYALMIARNCPAEIRKQYPLSMLRIAWSLLLTGKKEAHQEVMQELSYLMNDSRSDPALKGEWMLLNSYKDFPDSEAMIETLLQAEDYFNGKPSQVIIPAAPWCFGEINPFRAFHIKPGNFENEAAALERYLTIYTRLTNGHGSGGDALFRAWFAYSSGDLNTAEIFAYKAAYLAESKKQGVVLLGTAYLLAEIALHKSDADGWQNSVGSMERAVSFPNQNHYVTRAVADISRGLLFNQLGIPEHTADWLKEGKLTEQYILPQMYEFALQVYVGYLHRSEQYSKLAGTLEAHLSGNSPDRPFVEMVYCFLAAVGYFALGDIQKAEVFIDKAVAIAMPDGLVYPVAAYSWLLGGMTDKIMKEKYQPYYERYMEVKKRFAAGWEALHSTMLREALPAGLTERETEIAKLAAEGRRNHEIAELLFVSESTVRTHLRTIFQKLDIDRRAKLIEKLK